MKGVKTSTGWMLRLDVGDKLPDVIIEFCKTNDINTAELRGIGALRNSVLAYYSLEQKRYLEQSYPEHSELVSLNGNITLKEGKPFLHAHAIIADKELKTSGGHLVSGEVSATVELFITERTVVKRALDDKTGLYLWDLG